MEFTREQLQAFLPPQDLEGDDALKLQSLVDMGKPVWGVFRQGAKAGSIGLLSGLSYAFDWQRRLRFRSSCTITIEGREPYGAWGDDVGVLFDYQGPSVWKFTRVKGGANWTPIIDMTGQEIEVGDLVFAVEDDRMYYGKVERRSPVGTVWIKELTSDPEKRVSKDKSPTKCGPIRNRQILKVDGDMLGRLMLARLAG